MPRGIYKRIPGVNCGHMKGKHHSEETKQKIRKTKKGNSHAWNKGLRGTIEANSGSFKKGCHASPKTEFKKGQIPWNKGKKCPQSSGKNHYHWKGGRVISNGYVWIYKPNHPSNNHGYVSEHRLIVEKKIGRYLTPTETVHHIGNRADNQLNMLMAFVNNSAHKRFHSNPAKVNLSEIIYDGSNLKHL